MNLKALEVSEEGLADLVDVEAVEAGEEAVEEKVTKEE